MYTGLQVKHPFFLSDLNETWIFSTDFRNIYIQISNFMKICPQEPELLHADRQGEVNSHLTLQKRRKAGKS